MNKKKVLKIGIICFCLIALCVGVYFILKHFGITDVETIRSVVESCGVWGWLVFMLMFITASVFLCFIPGTSASFIVVSIVLFGAWKALIMSSVSVIIASSIMFFIGHTFGERVAEKIVGKDSLHKAQELIDVKSKIFLPLMFLFPVFPDDALCMVAGMTKMKYWYFLIVVAVCRTIGIATICFLGSGFINWASLSIIEWFCLITCCLVWLFVIFKASNKIEQKIKNKKLEEEDGK